MNLLHVTSPLVIKGTTIPNRVVRTAHTTKIGGGQQPSFPVLRLLAMVRKRVNCLVVSCAVFRWHRYHDFTKIVTDHSGSTPKAPLSSGRRCLQQGKKP